MSKARAKVSPEVLEAYYLDEIASRLGDLGESINQLNKNMVGINQKMDSMIPEGIVEPLGKGKPTHVTSTPVIVTPPMMRVGKLWFGVKITNDGPHSIWLIFNTGTSSEPQEIKPGETWGQDFKTAKIRDLYMYCNENEYADVRIRGDR